MLVHTSQPAPVCIAHPGLWRHLHPHQDLALEEGAVRVVRLFRVVQRAGV